MLSPQGVGLDVDVLPPGHRHPLPDLPADSAGPWAPLHGQQGALRPEVPNVGLQPVPDSVQWVDIPR